MEGCPICGSEVEIIKDQPYNYDECGLDVVLCGITQYACTDCGETFASIPDMQNLNRVIGSHVCQKRKAILKPAEIKFLRKDLHLQANQLAKTLGVGPSTVSRWENGKQEMDETYDRLLRSIYMMYASEEAHLPVHPGVVDMFQDLPRKRDRKKIEQPNQIILNPPEWLGSGRTNCSNTVQQPAARTNTTVP